MNKAVLIMPYYGKLPKYLGCYIKSLEGKNIDVLWVSDFEIRERPDNFMTIQMPFDEFLSLMERKLETPVSVFGDCDLLYGKKLNGFLDRVLRHSTYDVISMHKAYLSGPFCLLRNVPRLRNLFQEARNWKEMCAYNGVKRFLFDECGGEFHNQLCSGVMSMEECSAVSDSFSAVVWRTPTLNVYREDEITESYLANGEVVKMDNDILTIDGHEVSVFHYNLAKISRQFRYVNVPYEQVERCWIDRTGFYVSRLAWATRYVRRPWRMLLAAWESFRRHGLKHVFKRMGLLK